MFPVNVMWGHLCGLHITATTAIPEAVLTGLAFSLGRRAFLYAGGTAAMMSTSLGWVDRPYLLATWPFSLVVCVCVCVYEYMDVCIHVVYLATVSWSSLVEIDVFALFMRLYELWDYLSHSHHHTLSLRGLHSCKHPHQRYIITLAKKMLYLSSDSSPSRIMHANIPNNAHRSCICNSNHAQMQSVHNYTCGVYPCVRARPAHAHDQDWVTVYDSVNACFTGIAHHLHPENICATALQLKVDVITVIFERDWRLIFNIDLKVSQCFVSIFPGYAATTTIIISKLSLQEYNINIIRKYYSS